MQKINKNIEQRIYRKLSENQEFVAADYQYLFQRCLRSCRSKMAVFGCKNIYAEDIAQEAVFVLLNKLKSGSFRYDPQLGLMPFLHMTIQNLLMQESRKVVIMEDVYDKNDLACLLPEQFYCPKRLKARLREILPEKGYRLIMMSFFFKMSNEEIMHHLKYSNLNVVSTKKHRYLSMLREKLAPAMLAA
ncbi:MAG: RNA polymerase sigma factor [Cyclobacteriaceae bacterium]